MNKMLINALDQLNNLLAAALIIVCAVVGYSYDSMNGTMPTFTIIGLIAGFALAAVVCGLLATLIEIEKHLRKLASGPAIKAD
ncbi:AtpZ/AtpI family protein [Rhizobium sp. SL86]|uniref:AtpZ/AtpI family protein n=1 Tax=Rhizobium sp. SL86 TaxID=2995148 RepID=UPI002276A088|nr:AtpZ/AtpI family protein [Rhizobium sp. SL86]MCY1664592.1 AtpZ/AtpI family protein [Rhizobium sp. SL86]